MRLADWMKSKNVDDQALADRIGCDRSHVTKLRLGRTDPSMALARVIERESGGAVTLADWPNPRKYPGTEPETAAAQA